MSKFAASAALILTAALFVSPGEAAPKRGAAARAEAARVAKGLAFAQERCAACHGVTANAGRPTRNCRASRISPTRAASPAPRCAGS